MVLILLIVTIGFLNLCLGFGLAMHFGYGPPGLDGIFEALGPMPPASNGLQVPPPTDRQAVGNPASPSPILRMVPAEINQPTGGGNPRAGLLAEEKVLGDVCDLTATAQAVAVSGQVKSRE